MGSSQSSNTAIQAVQQTVSQTLSINQLLNAPNPANIGKVHTIVIGAGIGGMAAANQLAKAGKSVLVLEANNYIGGRLKTIPVKLSNNQTFMFEQGANWIHGSCKQNPITQLSQGIKNLQMVETNDESAIAYNQNREQVDQLVENESNAFQKIVQQIQGIENVENLSYEDAINKLDEDKIKNPFFMHNISNNLQFQTSAPINDLSAQHGQDDEQFQGKQMLICNGYQIFAENLQHQNIKVLLNQKVSKVSHQGKRKNIVKCSSGFTFEAQNIVIAIPIGVLKKHTIDFSPHLPQFKEEAIQKIHFGNVCKILITLKDKQIQHKQHYISVVDNNIDKRGSATYYLNLTSVAKIPALMTFGLGANADELQNMPQKSLKELIAKRLRVFEDQSFSPNDFQIVRTRWRGDQNCGGAYSYSGVQTKPHHWQDMEKPIQKYRWHFCGEHTNSMYRGTVHGAFLSGIRAAKEILQGVDKNQERSKSSESKSSKSSNSQKRKKKNSHEDDE